PRRWGHSPGAPSIMSDLAPQPPAPTPGPVATAPKPAAPAPKPTPKAAGKGADEDRRGILMFFFGSWFAFAWTTFTGALGLMTLGTLRFMIPNVLAEPPSRVKVGLPEAFEEGKVVEKFKDQNMWIVRYEGKIYALSTTCTHLGCTPNWL